MTNQMPSSRPAIPTFIWPVIAAVVVGGLTPMIMLVFVFTTGLSAAVSSVVYAFVMLVVVVLLVSAGVMYRKTKSARV